MAGTSPWRPTSGSGPRQGQPYYRADITKLFPIAAAFIAFLLVFVLAGIFLDITHPLQIPH